MKDYFDNSNINHDTFYEVLEEYLKKCRASYGFVDVKHERTTYVIDGRLFTVQSYDGDGNPMLQIKFWVGVNDKRLFYITYVTELPEKCKDVFAFCFGGAEKICWQFNYEPIFWHKTQATSIWGTCISENYLMERPRPGLPEEFTRSGRFWATDIAMMVQSQIRTMERYGMECSEFNPEPL
jgi:hypothetical protein